MPYHLECKTCGKSYTTMTESQSKLLFQEHYSNTEGTHFVEISVEGKND